MRIFDLYYLVEATIKYGTFLSRKKEKVLFLHNNLRAYGEYPELYQFLSHLQSTGVCNFYPLMAVKHRSYSILGNIKDFPEGSYYRKMLITSPATHYDKGMKFRVSKGEVRLEPPDPTNRDNDPYYILKEYIKGAYFCALRNAIGSDNPED